jgi:hypothetical protein
MFESLKLELAIEVCCMLHSIPMSRTGNVHNPSISTKPIAFITSIPLIVIIENKTWQDMNTMKLEICFWNKNTLIYCLREVFHSKK